MDVNPQHAGQSIAVLAASSTAAALQTWLDDRTTGWVCTDVISVGDDEKIYEANFSTS